MTDDEILERWNPLRDRVVAFAERCETDPSLGPSFGIVPNVSRERTLIGQPRGNDMGPPNMKAVWLRACAEKMINPLGWEYRVHEMVGGGAVLLLVGYKPPERDPMDFLR